MKRMGVCMTKFNKKKYMKSYYAANKDKIAAYQAAYNAANKDKVVAKHAAYMQLTRTKKKKMLFEDEIKNIEYGVYQV
jgi:hypothetical protein